MNYIERKMMNKPKQLKSKKAISSNGTVYWRPKWSFYDKDGQRKEVFGKSQSTKAKADAYSLKEVRDIETRNDLRIVSEDEALTVGQFAEKYWLKAERQINVKDQATIRTAVKFWKEIGLWDIKIEDLTSAMMYKMIKTLQDRGLKPTSIQKYKTELRTLIDLARVMGQTDRNVLNEVKLERRTQQQMDEADRVFNDMLENTWSLEEIQTNLEKLKNIPKIKVETKASKRSKGYVQERSATGNIPSIMWYGRFVIGFYLGLRTGEIMALKFSDFDFETNDVVISKAISKSLELSDNHEVAHWSQDESRVKSSSQRIQTCPDIVIEYVKQLALELDLLGIYNEDQYLFVNNKGHRIPLDYFRREFIRVQKHCGIERPLKSPKYTRHSSATVLAGLGWSSVDIANYLGHKNDRVTKEYYIQRDMETNRKMSESLQNGSK